jgi:hypothetical protein
LRAVDGLGDVGYLAVAPAADLVAEQPRATSPAGSDRAFGDGASRGPAGVPRRGHLDDVALAVDAHLQAGVVEVARRAVVETRGDRLEEPAVEPDRTASGSERKPVEIDGGGHDLSVAVDARPRIRGNP